MFTMIRISFALETRHMYNVEVYILAVEFFLLHVVVEIYLPTG